MSTQSWIIVGILVIANVVLIVSEIIRRRSEVKEVKTLRAKKEAEMVHRSGADSLETLNDEDLKDEIEIKQRYVWIKGIVVCLDIWIIGAVLTHLWASHYFTDITAGDSRKALFGDSFGAVNALVSALAFAGIIITIQLQRRDLRLQRKDLKLQYRELMITNDQLKGQKEQLEEQNQTLKIQRFENTFFQMLTQFQEIINNITYSYKDLAGVPHTVKGREAFYKSFEVALHETELQDWNPVHINHKYEGMRDIIKTFGYAGYLDAFTPTYFDHYFRFLYRILKFVETSPLVTEFDEEYEYTCMLRAMLSRYELVWLYYNGLAYGKDKLKPLIERYAMLNNLRGELLADLKDKFGVYSPSAWKKIPPVNVV